MSRFDRLWDWLIDLVTGVWLTLFALEFFVGLSWIGLVGLAAFIPIYVVDLGVKYLRVRNWATFIRVHWLSVLMVVPWLRVLRVFRLLRMLRLLRLVRVAKIGKWPGLQKAVGAYRRTKRMTTRRPIAGAAVKLRK